MVRCALEEEFESAGKQAACLLAGVTVVVTSSRAARDVAPRRGGADGVVVLVAGLLVRCAGGDREGTKTRAWEDNGIRSDWWCLGRGAHLYGRSFRLDERTDPNKRAATGPNNAGPERNATETRASNENKKDPAAAGGVRWAAGGETTGG